MQDFLPILGINLTISRQNLCNEVWSVRVSMLAFCLRSVVLLYPGHKKIQYHLLEHPS